MSRSLFGILHGRQIDLEHETGLPEGTRVAVQIEPEPSSAEYRERLLISLFGSMKDDPTFGEAVKKIVDQRRLGVLRDVNFDVARS